MADGVLGRFFLSFLGDRAGGVLGVLTVGVYLIFGRHKISFVV